jgi:hypothetical protein
VLQLTDDERRRVASTWDYRARSEVEAAARFARLTGELATDGAPGSVVSGVCEAAADERRHAELCAELCRAHGGEPNLEEREASRIGRAELSLRERLLWEMVSVCCVGETMNAALLGVSLEGATDPAVRRTLHALLTDEVRHARLGWAYLASARSENTGSFVAEILPLVLEASVEPELFSAQTVTLSDALRERGELSMERRRRLFVETLDTVVFPGLSSLGVDPTAGQRWLAMHG